MPLVCVYNQQTNIIERYNLGLLDPMPYVLGRTMTVGEFRASSSSSILWTDKSMINAWNAFRQGFGQSIFIGYAFKRIWEGGHSAQSQHYAGLALDTGHTLTQEGRVELWNYAVNSHLWSYVEPLDISLRWVHVDKRYGTPACASGGFPMQSRGSKGVYTFVLQDALTTLGYVGSGLDGDYGSGTVNSVTRFQAAQGLPVTGVVDCVTWTRLTSLANGIGATSTTIR